MRSKFGVRTISPFDAGSVSSIWIEVLVQPCPSPKMNRKFGRGGVAAESGRCPTPSITNNIPTVTGIDLSEFMVGFGLPQSNTARTTAFDESRLQHRNHFRLTPCPVGRIQRRRDFPYFSTAAWKNAE